MIVDFEVWVPNESRLYLIEQLGDPPYILVNFYSIIYPIISKKKKYVAKLTSRDGQRSASSWLCFFCDTKTNFGWKKIVENKEKTTWDKDGF